MPYMFLWNLYDSAKYNILYHPEYIVVHYFLIAIEYSLARVLLPPSGTTLLQHVSGYSSSCAKVYNLGGWGPWTWTNKSSS